jgi:multidrug efflux pump subunit AcrB
MLNGKANPGFNQVTPSKRVQEVVAEHLPKNIYVRIPSGMTREEILAGKSLIGVFLLSLDFRLFFKCQYESYLVTSSVIFSLPVGIFSKRIGFVN